jgi:hypothetical protein
LIKSPNGHDVQCRVYDDRSEEGGRILLQSRMSLDPPVFDSNEGSRKLTFDGKLRHTNTRGSPTEGLFGIGWMEGCSEFT